VSTAIQQAMITWVSNWHAFFNPLVAKTGNLRDPEHGDEDTEPKTFKELRKLKYNVSRKAQSESEEEEIQAKEEEEKLQTKRETGQNEEKEEILQSKSNGQEKEKEENIQRSEIGSPGGFASNGLHYETEDSPADIQAKAEGKLARQVRNKSPGAMIQGGWLGDAWNAVSGLASDVAELIEEGLDAAKNWLLDKVRDFVVEIPGYTLLSYILGYDPITGRGVDKTPLTLLDAVLDIIPIGGSMVKWVLEYFEAINPVANWLFDSVKRFSALIASVESRFENFWNRLSIEDAGNPERVMSDVANLFQSIVTDIVDFVAEVGGDFLTMVKDIAISTLVTFVKEYFPDAYDLLVLLLGEDPISGEQVAFNGTNILNASLKVLGERGAQIKAQMLENGIFGKCVEWIDRSIGLVQDLVSDVGNIFTTIWDLITFDSLFTPIETFTRIAQAFLTPINRIIAFFTDAMVILVGILREALLSRLSAYAKETRGYFLITVLIGKDPFTGAIVRRNTENMIHGFFSLMEGGEAQFQQLKESGKIDQMTQKVTRAVNQLNFTWAYVIGLFTSLWESLDWNDFLNPFGVFARIVATFGDPVIRLVRFVITIVQIVVEILLIAMNFPFETVNNIIQRSLEAFGNIKRDPIGFLKNILRGIKQGFTQFFDNILTHLMSGLATWLFGSLGELGIQMPPDLSFKSILNLIMQILGISVDRIMERVWLKLTEQIGAEKVAKIRGAIDKLTGIWTFIKDVIERGPIAIWEYVQEKLSELWNMVLDAAKNWIMTRIIASVTTKLLSMLDPTGIMAVINSVIAIYRAIQSFIEQLRAMLEILNSFVNGIAEIAAGNVSTAANFLEGAMARGIPVLIGFLANQVGLGGIGRRLAEIIQSIREKITEGIDWLVEKALRMGRPIIDGVLRVIEFGEGVVDRGREALGAARDAVMGWLGLRKRFNAQDGSSHSLYFSGTAENAELMVASNPTTVTGLLRVVRSEVSKPANQQHQATFDQVETENREINTLKQRLKNPNSSTAQADNVSLNSKLDTIAPKIGILMPMANATEPPPLLKPSFTNGVKASGFKVHYLKHGRTSGGSAAGTNNGATLQGWPRIVSAGLSNQAAWVKMHLLADIGLGGPALDSNLTPARREDNTRFFNSVERNAATDIRNNQVIWYNVEIGYHGTPNRDYANYVKMEYGPYELNTTSGVWEEKAIGASVNGQPVGHTDSISPDIPDFTGTVLDDINDLEWRRIVNKAPGLDRPFAAFLVRVRDSSNFTNVNNMESRLRASYANRTVPIVGFASQLSSLVSQVNITYTIN